jgi:hypothetical protein
VHTVTLDFTLTATLAGLRSMAPAEEDPPVIALRLILTDRSKNMC